MRIPVMEIFTKMHATITRDRLHGFGSDFDYRFATEPEGSQSKISPGTPVGRHLAGGQFFRFPGVPRFLGIKNPFSEKINPTTLLRIVALYRMATFAEIRDKKFSSFPRGDPRETEKLTHR